MLKDELFDVVAHIDLNNIVNNTVLDMVRSDKVNDLVLGNSQTTGIQKQAVNYVFDKNEPFTVANQGLFFDEGKYIQGTGWELKHVDFFTIEIWVRFSPGARTAAYVSDLFMKRSPAGNYFNRHYGISVTQKMLRVHMLNFTHDW